MSKKTPQIRFKGFTDDWEERKLGELLKSAYQGINTAGDKVIYSEKGCLLYTSDAADEEDSVDIGSSRIIKKTKIKKKK